MKRYDAVVVGSGPNGLAAAVELTRDDRKVLVVEGADTIGGGTRTEELTLPGFLHDMCSAIHPLGVASPFFRSNYIGDWIHPEIPATHPLDDGRVAVLHRSLDRTAEAFGDDESRYRRVLGPLVEHADDLMTDILGPLRARPARLTVLGRFGALGALPASTMVKALRSEEARALLAGLAAHAVAPFNAPLTGAVAEMFALTAHAYGWPLARSGSQSIAHEMSSILLDAGGDIETGRHISALDDLPDAPIVLLDVMPPAALKIGASRVDAASRRRMMKWGHGPGVFKVDWALDGPIPWSDGASGRAGAVHVGGTYGEIAEAEADVHAGRHPELPFVIVAQQSLFDASRAPADMQTAWGYCHVPAGSTLDMTDAIEAQVERFAPGFRDRILATHTTGPAAYESHNPNYVAGDIAGGTFGIRRALRFGAVRPYRIGDGLYLCSSATPPGAGVHGMCGYHAARAAIVDTP